MLENRQEQIHNKGFFIGGNYVYGGPGGQEDNLQFNKIKVGVKSLEDAVFNLGDIVKCGH